MIKYIIFDLGHVLVDIDPKRSLKAFGQLVERKEDNAQTSLITADGLLGGHSSKLIDLYQIGEITTDQFCGKILQYCKKGVTKEQIIEAWLAMLLPVQQRKRELLLHLHERNIPFYILSNINDTHVDWVYQNLPEINLSSGIFFSNEIHIAKPDLRAYQLLIEKTGINPQETLYIDDLQPNIDGGQQVGLQTLLAPDDEAWISKVEELINKYK